SSIVTFLRYHEGDARGQLRAALSSHLAPPAWGARGEHAAPLERDQYPQVATLGPASAVWGNVAHAPLAHCWHAAQSATPVQVAVARQRISPSHWRSW